MREPMVLCHNFLSVSSVSFIEEPWQRKGGKKWEVDDIQESFIRAGLGHVLGFGS